ncbi:hypothetical protein BDR07DRAFT_1482156 [Suillus spraguei]|nr:hypothetical protein BDR07DRAFT_1482156 [Suillus spraguei]
MSPTADTRSRNGGINYDESADAAFKCSTMADSSPCTKGTTLRRFKKEEGVIYRIPSSSDLASLFASDKGKSVLVDPPTLKRRSSSPLNTSIRPLKAARRLLRTSETVALPETTCEHAVKNSTSSLINLPSKKLSARKLQRSASSRVEDGAGTDIASITSRILQRLTNLQVPFDLHDVGEPAQPSQLLIACTSTNDFDPLVIPDVAIVDLVCTTVAINGPYKSYPQIAFRTFYAGATIRYVNDVPTPNLFRGIHIGNVPWCCTMDEDGNFGWFMRFWIPIPFALFQRAETRAFKIDAKVHFNEKDGKDGFLNASSDFTLSRLQRGLAM